MVASTAKSNKASGVPRSFAIPKSDLKWCAVSLSEVIGKGNRLDASVFDVDGKHARDVLRKCKWEKVPLTGDDGLATAYHCLRFKRIWVDASELPIFQPAQIAEINPKPSGYLSTLTKTNIEKLRVSKGQVLLTCSGTIGKARYVSETLDKQIFSHDLIRINGCSESDRGYIYAYLKSQVGSTIIKTNQYGAVVSHIEPDHLDSVPIPNPPEIIKKRISVLVTKSFKLRDEANQLLDDAEQLLHSELGLPSIDSLKVKYFKSNDCLRNYNVNLSKLNNRLDASYHLPLIDEIVNRFKKTAGEVIKIGDPKITKDILLPGRFKRIYVDEGQGAVYFSGKNVLELDPSDKRYLSFSQHQNRIREHLTIHEGMILITCSGTLGKIAYVYKHWDGWVMTHDIIRLIPASIDISGYIYVFLRSDYGQALLKRSSYGAVVQHIEKEHLADTPIPLLSDKSKQDTINKLALKANGKLTEAYELEQQAVEEINELVIFAR